MSDTQIERRLLDGDWRVVMGEVVVVTGAPVTDNMMAWTSVLTIGYPVALAGRFGGAWLRLDGSPKWQTPEVVIPHARGKLVRPGIEIRRTRGPWQVTTSFGLPVTPVPVTIRDLAAKSSHGDVRDVVQHALRRRRTSFEALAATLRRGVPGSSVLRAVLEEVGPGYQSLWERRLHLALRNAGVHMKPQVLVEAPGGRVAFLDLGIEELKYGVEIDGFVNHMKRFASDRRRARVLAKEAGWLVDNYAVEELAANMTGVVREVATTVARLEGQLRRTG